MGTSLPEKGLKVPVEVTTNGHTPEVRVETATVSSGTEPAGGRIQGAVALGALRVCLGFVFLWSFLDLVRRFP